MGLSESIKKLRKLVEIENNRTYSELMQLMVMLNTVRSECEVLEQLREYGGSMLKYFGSGFISYLTDYYDDAILREYGFIVNPRSETPVEPEEVNEEPIYLMLDEEATQREFRLPDAQPVIYIYSYCHQVEIVTGRVTALGETVVVAKGTSVVIGMGQSMVYGRDEATVSLKEYAQAEMSDHSRCILTDQAFCTARDFVSVTASRFAKVRLYGNHVSATMRDTSLFFATGSPAYLSIHDSAMGMALNARCVEMANLNVHDPLPFETQEEVKCFSDRVMPANPKLMAQYIEGDDMEAFEARRACCMTLAMAIPTESGYDMRSEIKQATADWQLEQAVLPRMGELYEWDCEYQNLRMAFREERLESYRIFTNDLRGVPELSGSDPYYVMGNVVANMRFTEAKGYFAQNAIGIIDDSEATAKGKCLLVARREAQIAVSESSWGIALDESTCTADNGRPMVTGMDQSHMVLLSQSRGISYQEAHVVASDGVSLIHMSEEQASVTGRAEVLTPNQERINALPTASVKPLPTSVLYKNMEGLTAEPAARRSLRR